MTFSREDLNIKAIGLLHGRLLMTVFIETGRHIGNQLLV